MNEEILNQEGLDESLINHIRENLPRSEEVVEEITEEVVENNDELVIEDAEILDLVGDENEVVEEPTIDDIDLEEVEDESELND